jgi:hypothetical protein
MAKRIKPRMVEYARSLGATTKRGPDWYLVAEHLAEIANPELLKNEPAEGTPRPGRRQNQDDFFAMEVHRVMSVYDCGVRAACEKIARGKREVPLPARGGSGATQWAARGKVRRSEHLKHDIGGG